MATQTRAAKIASSPLDGAHFEGCSAERVESYPVVHPSGAPATVVRCLDCGGSVVIPSKKARPSDG